MVPADAEPRSNERCWFLSAQETVSGCPFGPMNGRAGALTGQADR